MVSAVFRACPQGTVIMDCEQRIVTVNPAFEEITGYSIEDVEGSDLAMLVEVDPGAAAVMESVRAEGSWEGEIDA
ncbi:MAG: PAS domain S-box protein, partial [Gammaproteobacteria bacterium]